MNRAILAVVVLAFSACGGGGAPSRPAGSFNYQTAASRDPSDLIRYALPGSYLLTKAEFPELHAVARTGGIVKVHPLLGNPRRISYGTMGQGEETVYFIRPVTEGPEGALDLGEVLLYHAMKSGDVDKAKDVIAKRNLPLNRPASASVYGSPPLHWVLDGNLAVPRQRELVEMLLRQGAKPGVTNERGDGALQALLASQQDVPNRRDLLGALLKAGADPNQRNSRGETALLTLLSATWESPQRKDMLEALLKAKADPNATNQRGEAPLHMVLSPQREVPSRKELLDALLKAGANPNLPNERGEGALHTLLGSQRDIPNRKDYLEALLKAGADPNAASKEGKTPLKAVLASGIENKKEILALLVTRGADPDRPDPSGQPLLHEAVTLTKGPGQAVFEEPVIGWLDVIVTPKTNLNARNKEGKTPLQIAYLAQRDKLRAYLQSRGATDYGFKNPGYDLSKANGVTLFGLGSSDVFALNAEQCHFILREYDVQFDPLANIPGVEIPITLKSPINGIAYRHVTQDRKFSIMDCRLAVVLVGWSPILKKHNVKEIIHMRVYAPGAKVGGFGRISGHNFALALDVAQIVYEDRPEQSVKGDWKDHRKLDPCADALPGQSPREHQLRRMTCETGNFDLFSVILSPHYNKAHFDHLHMELDVKQYMFMR